jgi:hypothetical protein
VTETDYGSLLSTYRKDSQRHLELLTARRLGQGGYSLYPGLQRRY